MNKQEDNADVIAEQEGRDEMRTGEGADGRAGTSSRESWRRQIIGALIGGFVTLMLSSLAVQFGWIGGNPVTYALWGGVIGGIIGGSESLEQAGARLTRRDAPLLNMVVALLGMAVIFGIVFVIVWAITQLIQRSGM